MNAAEPAPDWLTDEDESSRQVVWLVTLSATLNKDAGVGEQLQNPSALSREEVRDAILGAIANPVTRGVFGGRPRSRPLRIGFALQIRARESTIIF